MIKTNTGNKIVDAIGKMNLTGNLIPSTWFETVRNETGKANMNAIVLLSEIVYWYRPTEERDEFSDNVSFSKKFKADDFVQMNYVHIAEKFAISKSQAITAMRFLENEVGVVKRHLRKITTNQGLVLSNVLFIELIPERLWELTYPDADMIKTAGEVDEDNGNNKEYRSDTIATSLEKHSEVSESTEGSADENCVTNTEIITKNSSEISTEKCVWQLEDEVLTENDYKELSEKFPKKILDTTIKRIIERSYKGCLNVETISKWCSEKVALRGENCSIGEKNNNHFHNFPQREYSSDAMSNLEKTLLRQSQQIAGTG